MCPVRRDMYDDYHRETITRGQANGMAVPGLNEHEAQMRFIELVYGKELADEVANWKAGKQVE